MKNRIGSTLLVAAAIGLIAAAAITSPEDLVRQANAAFDRGDYARAVDLYKQAEERITDPGLVAFNQATALYQLAATTDQPGPRLALYRDAEIHYRRCLSDAEGARLARGLYNLGNCLVQRSQGDDVELLEQAMVSFERCLRQDVLDDELRANASHNIELAKLLWVKAKANPRKKQENPPGGDDGPQPRDGSGDPGDDGRDPGRIMRASADRQPGVRADGSPEPIPTNERQPGTGTLPPVADKDALAPLSAEDAAQHLERAAARIAKERRKRQSETIVAPAANVKDW